MDATLREHSNHNVNRRIEDNLCKFHTLTIEDKTQVYDHYKEGDPELSDKSNIALKLLLKQYMNIELIENEKIQLDKILDECRHPQCLEDIDICWLLFFLSGDVNHIDIVKKLRDDPNSNEELKQAAKWSYEDIKRHYYANI